MPLSLRLHPFDFTPTADEEIDYYVESHISDIVRADSSVGIQRNPNDPLGITSFISWNPSDLVERNV